MPNEIAGGAAARSLRADEFDQTEPGGRELKFGRTRPREHPFQCAQTMPCALIFLITAPTLHS